jgi:riboflavin kinase / FMN adenylyltransferase
MKIFRGFEESMIIKNAVVTTGSFDGVHIGHKTILKRLQKLAQQENGESVLITFDPHPRKVLYPDTTGKELKLINSQEEKLELLKYAGLDNVIIIEFTKEFARISSEQFVRDYLIGILKAKVIVAGFNHHFGFNKEGDYKQLWEWREKYNYNAEEIPEQEVQHERVSSTIIRKAITDGYIQRTNSYLDHYYIIIGKTEPIVSDGFSASFPLFRVLITENSKLLPSPGIFAVSVEADKCQPKGMVIVIHKSDYENEVLLHIFNNRSLLPGQKVIIYFRKKVHGSVNMNDIKTVGKIRAAKEEISELIY